MAKGWRKDEYNRQIFGQKIRACRSTLQWSLGELAQASEINKGTLQHVEKGESHLPNTKRQILVHVLAVALEKIGQPVNRRAFLEVAGLTTASTILSGLSSPAQLQTVEMPGASGQGSLFLEKSHEEIAEILNRQQEWQQAATFWLLAAHEAKLSGDWATWSRCLLNAGLMAVNRSQFEIAERRFEEVIVGSHDEVGTLAIAEAYLRLGWLYYEQDKFCEARQALLKSLPLLQDLVSNNPRSLHLPEHGSTLVYCEGNELIMALESTRLHWLGRTYVDWGIERENQALIKEGAVKLQKAGDYDGKLGLSSGVGFALLRQIPALLYEGDLNTTENYLARSEELLGTRGTLRGHIYLHKGLLTLEEQPKKAEDFLENARAGFIEPTFYSRGLARVFKEMSGIYSMDGKKSGDELALRYALAAAVLHPYGRSLELLRLAAHKMYWRLGENLTAFNKVWQALLEEVWSMDSEPFSDLRYLMKYSQEDGVHSIEAAIEVARKAIDDELFRK